MMYPKVFVLAILSLMVFHPSFATAAGCPASTPVEVSGHSAETGWRTNCGALGTVVVADAVGANAFTALKFAVGQSNTRDALLFEYSCKVHGPGSIFGPVKQGGECPPPQVGTISIFAFNIKLTGRDASKYTLAYVCTTIRAGGGPASDTREYLRADGQWCGEDETQVFNGYHVKMIKLILARKPTGR
jgi:hypothetical protein